MGGAVARVFRPPPRTAPTPVYASPTKAGAKGLGDNALTTSKKTLLGG